MLLSFSPKENHKDGTLILLGVFDNVVFLSPETEWISLCG